MVLKVALEVRKKRQWTVWHSLALSHNLLDSRMNRNTTLCSLFCSLCFLAISRICSICVLDWNFVWLLIRESLVLLHLTLTGIMLLHELEWELQHSLILSMVSFVNTRSGRRNKVMWLSRPEWIKAWHLILLKIYTKPLPQGKDLSLMSWKAVCKGSFKSLDPCACIFYVFSSLWSTKTLVGGG